MTVSCPLIKLIKHLHNVFEKDARSHLTDNWMSRPQAWLVLWLLRGTHSLTDPSLPHEKLNKISLTKNVKLSYATCVARFKLLFIAAFLHYLLQFLHKLFKTRCERAKWKLLVASASWGQKSEALLGTAEGSRGSNETTKIQFNQIARLMNSLNDCLAVRSKNSPRRSRTRGKQGEEKTAQNWNNLITSLYFR